LRDFEKLENRCVLSAIPWSAAMRIVDDDTVVGFYAGDVDHDNDNDLVYATDDNRIVVLSNVDGVFEKTQEARGPSGEFVEFVRLDDAIGAYRDYLYIATSSNIWRYDLILHDADPIEQQPLDIEQAEQLYTDLDGVSGIEVMYREFDEPGLIWAFSDHFGSRDFSRPTIPMGTTIVAMESYYEHGVGPSMTVAVRTDVGVDVYSYSGQALTACFCRPTKKILEIPGARDVEIGMTPFDADIDHDVVVVSDIGTVNWLENGQNSIELFDEDLSFVATHEVAIRDATSFESGNFDVEVSDINGDGFLDILVAESGIEGQDGRLQWLENRTDDLLIPELLNHGQVVSPIALDVDEDTATDIVTIVNGELVWFRNASLDRTSELPHGAQQLIGDVASDVSIADMDGDGDVDLLARDEQHNVLLYENRLADSGSFADGRIVDGVGNVSHFLPSDVNGDGVPDLLTFVGTRGPLYARLNLGNGRFPLRRLIDAENLDWTTGLSSEAPLAFDVDGDGDDDIVGRFSSELVWYENTGIGETWLRNVIDGGNLDFGWNAQLQSVDIDNDGDYDIVEAYNAHSVDGYPSQSLRWFENSDGQFLRHVIFKSDWFEAPRPARVWQVQLLDYDRDGDTDVLANHSRGFVLYTNSDGMGKFEEGELLSRGTVDPYRRNTMMATDADGDGDFDLMQTKDWWFENLGEAGYVRRPHSLNGSVLIDFDNDGDDDLFSTVNSSDNKSFTMTWYEHRGFETAANGDFNNDGGIDGIDVDLLCDRIANGVSDDVFDLNSDGGVDSADLDHLIVDLLKSRPGDVNLDGRFSSADLVLIFQAGEYDDGIAANSSWTTGDWNCDGDFDSSDLVAAFILGGYEDETG
jgi:hypothetical protein